MGNREFEQMLERLMKQDFSAGTETFRDALLERCLAVLDADDEGICLDDSDLELLAAAGDAIPPRQLPQDSNGTIAEEAER